MNNPVRKQFQFGDQTVELETGRIAKQSSGAVLVTIDGTVVLCTVVAEKKARPGRDFFPLTVNYQEKTYAAGKIPGGFFRREGRPSEKEQLTSRLIDRPLRPLFPKGFMNEVQVICTVMSVDRDVDPDIASLIGSSAALALSGIPFAGPIAAARVGYTDGAYLLNPTHSQLKESALNMVVAGTRSAVLMVESEADQLTVEVHACLEVPDPDHRVRELHGSPLFPLTMILQHGIHAFQASFRSRRRGQEWRAQVAIE